MIAAALSQLVGSKALAYIGTALAAIALVVAIYQTGVNAERKRGEAATLRAQVQSLRLDLAAAEAAAALDRQIADANRAAALGNSEKLRDLETRIVKRAPQDRCALSPDDARRLRAIR